MPDSFHNIHSSIASIERAIKQFPNIHRLFNDEDYVNWQTKLSTNTDHRDFLFGTNRQLNFLNLSAIVAFGLENKDSSNFSSPFIEMYSNLNSWLGLFPQLITSESFKTKITNLSAYSLPATLSELSISAAFKSMGYKIEFENQFTQKIAAKNRDIDVSVIDDFGNAMHIEVYMPNEQISTDGFFDVNEANGSFKFKVERKLDKKFGNEGIVGLSGIVLLAVNIAHFDSILIKSKLPFFSNDDLYEGFTGQLPKGIDGLLFFRDGFTNNIPFCFEQLVLKNTSTPT